MTRSTRGFSATAELLVWNGSYIRYTAHYLVTEFHSVRPSLLSIYLSIPVMHRAQTEHCRAWGPPTAQKK